MAKTNSGCMILFALPFAGVGVGMTIWMGWTLVAWSRARSWIETPATIVKAELVESSDSDGGTTYKATAEYVYAFDGKEFRSTSVGLSGGSDNIGSYQQDMHRRLAEHQRTGRPFPCFVNPDDAAESLLDRDLRWGMLAFQALFAVAFGGAGGGILIGAVYGMRGKRRQASLAATAPEKPWLWRSDWAEGLIPARTGWRVAGAVGFALAWNLICAPVWFLLPGEVFVKGNRVAAIGFVFPAVGLALAAWAVIEVMRRRKYGVSTFQMAAVPGVVGGQLAGVVRIPVRLEPEDGFRTALRCYLQRVVHSSDGHSTERSVVWEAQQVVVQPLRQGDPTITAIPVQIAVPYGCRPSDVEQGDNTIAWQLEVSAKAPGVDYCAEFEVPVFRTEDSREDFQLDTSAIAEYVAPVDPKTILAESGVEMAASPEGEGIRLIFARARHPGMLGFFLLFTAIWSGGVAAMLWCGAPIVLAVIFGLFDLLLLYGCFSLLFYRSVVDVTPQGVRLAAGYFVLAERWIDAAEIDRGDVSSGMSSGNTRYFDLSVFSTGGKRITLGKRIRGQQAAELVLAELNKALRR